MPIQAIVICGMKKLGKHCPEHASVVSTVKHTLVLNTAARQASSLVIDQISAHIFLSHHMTPTLISFDLWYLNPVLTGTVVQLVGHLISSLNCLSRAHQHHLTFRP